MMHEYDSRSPFEKGTAMTYFIPMEISCGEAIRYGYDPKRVKPMKIGARKTCGIYVAATEEQYHCYMRMCWNEEKRNQREWKQARLLSLEKFADDDELEIPEEGDGSIEQVELKILLDYLIEQLHEEDPELEQIFQMLLNDESQRTIAAAIGKSQSCVTKKVAKIRELLRSQL